MESYSKGTEVTNLTNSKSYITKHIVIIRSKQPLLCKNYEVIKLKVILLSIMNLVFSRASHDRTITFNDIATKVHIPLDQVEWMLMKALSLNLIKGTMNELKQTIEVTWVQPRVLNKLNIEMLSVQLEAWTAKVKSTLLTVEEQAAEL